MIEDFQKETFWQRVGFKKVNKELPLYGIANESLRRTRINLQKILLTRRGLYCTSLQKPSQISVTGLDQNRSLPRKVAVGKWIMARRTLVTMSPSQQPDWRIYSEMSSSSARGLMQILPGDTCGDTAGQNWLWFGLVRIVHFSYQYVFKISKIVFLI